MADEKEIAKSDDKAKDEHATGKLCECGCGREVREGKRFVHGHNGNNKGKTFPKEIYPNFGGRGKGGKKFPIEIYPNYGPRGKTYPAELFPNFGNRGRKFPKELYPNFGPRCKKYPTELYPNFGNRGKKYPIEQYPNFGGRGKTGHIPWNKDLTKMTDPRVAKISEKQKGRPNLRAKGRTFPAELYPNYGMRGKLIWSTGHTAKTDPRIAGQAEKLHTMWQDPDYREKNIPAILKGMFKRPTSLERKGIELHEKYELPFIYCGNGTLLIGFKNPDFYESNGKKLCLEYANRFHHPGDYESKRVAHFAKYGWKCLVIWEEELKDSNKVAEKIRAFCAGAEEK